MRSPTLHNPEEVLLGSVGVSDSEVSHENGDPSDFPSGTAVRIGTDNKLSLSAGQLIGISLGRSLLNEKQTSVARLGQKVPLRLTDESEYATIKIGDITFTAKEKGEDGNSISITLSDTKTDASAEASLDGSAITVEMEDAATVASAIKTALEAVPEIAALISVEIDAGDEAVAQAAAAETFLADGEDAYPYVVEGAAVEIDLTTGHAVSDGQATGAIYSHSGHKSGVIPGFYGDPVDVAQVDMVGGL